MHVACMLGLLSVYQREYVPVRLADSDEETSTQLIRQINQPMATKLGAKMGP